MRGKQIGIKDEERSFPLPKCFPLSVLDIWNLMSILYACVVSRLHVPHARPSGRQPPGAQVMLQIPGALSGSLGRCISRDLAGQWRLAAPTMTNNGPSPRRPPLCSSVSKGWRDVPAVGCASRMLEADWPSHFLPLLLCAERYYSGCHFILNHRLSSVSLPTSEMLLCPR